MQLNKTKLGFLIEQITETNNELLYGLNDVMGMTISKDLIPTKADLSDTKLDNFIIVKPKEFVYNPRTHGYRIGLGFNNTEKCFLISWNNIAFKIKEEAKNIILPEYLYIYFNRDEWDRAACFDSWGSSTEVFSWDSLCDMQIELPSIEVQQKYVDIYMSLKANIEFLENQIKSLIKACFLVIPENKNSNKIQIGSFVKLYNENCNISDLTINDVSGINRDKEFFEPSKQVGVDTSKYKIVPPNYFACNLMHVGRDIVLPIALNTTNSNKIVSPAYTVFSINNNIEIISEYFLMIINSEEKDRFFWFNTDSSIRDGMDWDVFCNMEIPVPKIEIQKKYVDIFKAKISLKAELNRLKQIQKNICPILIKGSIDEVKRCEVAKVG